MQEKVETQRTNSDGRVRISDLSILIVYKKKLKFSGLNQMEGSEFRTSHLNNTQEKIETQRTNSDGRVRISDFSILIVCKKKLKFSGLIQMKGSEFRTSPS